MPSAVSRRRRLVVAAFRVAPHVPFRSGEHSERSVSGAVGEQPALYPDRCVIVHTGRHDGRNGARAGLLDPGDFVAEEKGDVLLGKDGVQLFVIFIDLRRTCIAFGGGPEFVEQVAQRRIFADVQTASETYPDFGGVVAAEYLPVLYEGDFHPPPRRRDSRTHAGYSAACYHESELALVFGHLRQPHQPAAQDEEPFERVVRPLIGGGEENRVAASVESGRVV